jgi:hypothetical protein
MPKAAMTTAGTQPTHVRELLELRRPGRRLSLVAVGTYEPCLLDDVAVDLIEQFVSGKTGCQAEIRV